MHRAHCRRKLTCTNGAVEAAAAEILEVGIMVVAVVEETSELDKGGTDALDPEVE